MHTNSSNADYSTVIELERFLQHISILCRTLY